MTNSIKELEKMILNDDIKLSVILQHALVVASEYDENFIPWIKQEMDGYTGENYPEYRQVHGKPKAMNEYGSWVPYVITNSEDQNAISKMHVGISSPVLENTINACSVEKSDVLHFSYPSEIQKRIAIKGAVQFALEVQPHAIVNILDKVRIELLDWVIGLNKKEEHGSSTTPSKIIFPQELISRLPKDLKILADSFNLNFSHDEADVCMFIMRRMLPLSIVKKFEQTGQEETIKKGNDYLDTMPLLAKAEHLITKRCYKDIVSYKRFLDASQHSYTFSIDTSDVINVATTLRLLFDELFPNMENKVR